MAKDYNVSMGLFKKIFKLGKDAIENSFKEGELVSLLTNLKIKIGDTLKVGTNEVAIFMVREKICEIFTTGEHQLNFATMPLAIKTLKKIYKIDESNPPKHIFVDLYFINTNSVAFTGLVSEKIKIIIDKKRKTKIKVSFNTNVNVADPKTLIKSLRIYSSRVTNKLAKMFIADCVCENIALCFEKCGTILDKIPKPSFDFLKVLEEKTNEKIAFLGIKIDETAIKEYFMKERFKKTFEEIGISSTSLDKEINDFIGEQGEDMVLEKVGTESYLDNFLDVKKVSSGEISTETTILNLPTGEEAKKEIIMKSPKTTDEYLKKLQEFSLEDNLEERSGEEILNKQNTTQEYGSEAEFKFCTTCGNKILASDNFCGKCGKKVR